MTVLNIGPATKAFINEHIEWYRSACAWEGRAFHEKSKRGELMEIAVALSLCSLDKLKVVHSINAPVTSAIAGAMLLDN